MTQKGYKFKSSLIEFFVVESKKINGIRRNFQGS